MARIRETDGAALPLEIMRQIDAVCDEFEAALKHGAGVCFDNYIGRVDRRWREFLLEELRFLAFEQLRRAGVQDPNKEILSANPAVHDDLTRIALRVNVAATTSGRGRQQSSIKSSGLVVRCPHCRLRTTFLTILENSENGLDATYGRFAHSLSALRDALRK